MNLLQAVDDPKLFGPWFKDPSTWAAWRAYLAALFGLPMSQDQLEVYTRCTGRSVAPTTPFSEAYLVCGRRAGKSFVLALIAVFLACFRDYSRHLAPGERATVLVVAADRKQSRVIFRYLAALLHDVAMLAPLIERETAESFDLRNHVTIEVGTASYRTTRGYAFCAVLCDELAFWRTDDSANPDVEVLAAVRPGMSTIPNSLLICASSPYSRRGALWDAFRRWHGKDDAPALVWRAPTLTMNPTVPASVITEAMERDPASAAAEYNADFRSDIESFISIEAVRACINAGVRERAPDRQFRFVGFVDPSGGSSDSMTLAIAHKEGNTAVLDVVREIKAPLSPEAACAEFANVLRSYRIAKVTGDRYGAEWVAERFRENGIFYEPSQHTKSELYQSLLPMVNSRACDLLDSDRLVSQLIGLERRTGRSGKDSIDHAPGGHDDIANAVAGSLVLASKLYGDGRDFRQRREKRGLDMTPRMPPIPYSGNGEPGVGWLNW